MSPSNPLDLSPEARSTLAHLLSVLHLFAHRNKNQHRHSIWWRHFSLLRRQLSHLLADLARFHAVPTTHLGRARQKTLNPALTSRNVARREFWRDVLVPRSHDAFSQLVADQRFAQLGLVLLAALAEVSGVLGLTAEMEEAGQAEVERVLEEFGKEEWGPRRDSEGGHGLEGGDGEDVGEVVERDRQGKAGKDAGVEGKPGKRGREDRGRSSGLGEKEGMVLGGSSEMVEKTERRKKKKRKKGDAIDDLFSGLG